LNSNFVQSVHVSLLLIWLGAAGLRFPKCLTSEIISNPTDKQLKKQDSGAPAAEAFSLLDCIKTSFSFPSLTAFYYVVPSVVFVSLYSILPHKELRFIFPALPMLTLTAGAALDRLLPPDGGDILFPLSLFVGNREGSSAKPTSKGFGKKAFVSLYRCDVIALLRLLIRLCP
jgi:hypothetical protein